MIVSLNPTRAFVKRLKVTCASLNAFIISGYNCFAYFEFLDIFDGILCAFQSFNNYVAVVNEIVFKCLWIIMRNWNSPGFAWATYNCTL